MLYEVNLFQGKVY